jgi:hypothetical protein
MANCDRAKAAKLPIAIKRNLLVKKLQNQSIGWFVQLYRAVHILNRSVDKVIINKIRT